MTTAGWQDSVALHALEHTLTTHLAAKGVSVDALLNAGPPVTQTAADTTAGRGTVQTPASTQVTQAGGAAFVTNPPLEAASQMPPMLTRHAARATKAMPEPQLAQSPRQIDVGDRMVDVLLSMSRPRVVVFGNFLSEDECAGLIEAARPRMARSLTVENATGGEAVNADRTSNGMFFRRAESELVARIESRIARLLHWPLENGEGVQVLNYPPGAEYKPHYDYFDPAAPGTPTILKRGGQRVGTLVMYLNNPERGGGTTFPDVGLEVAPQRGNAVFFAYDRPHPSSQTLHGGAPVVSGEKWVATKWLREHEFV
ncbi:MAG: 2OG-Fe(II) oxygenase [Burkholderiales bacterium]|nr:2OG-Fe(II) oxygenase [Burkholderiales bacterium]